jgi:hypothetical protein
MPFIGNTPSAVPLTSADIADGIITSAKIVDGTIVNADISASAGITSAKLDDLANPFGKELFHVRDEKGNGVAGGNFTSGAWQTRTLNTSMTNEISGASLSSNQITLPSGTYFINASASVYYVDQHKLKLRNITDSSDTLIGTSSYSGNLAETSTTSFVIGRFTIAAQKTFELQHRCSTTKNSNGFGVSTVFGTEIEVYADVQIWKVA